MVDSTKPLKPESLTMNANTLPAAPAYKFPFAKTLIDAMTANLTANNADPDAFDAWRDARELARTPAASSTQRLETAVATHAAKP